MQTIQTKATKWLGISAVVAATAFSVNAEAASISGQINFAGAVKGLNAANVAQNNWNNAVKLDFTGSSQSLNGNIDQTGTYAPLTGLFSPVAFSNFTFKPALSPASVNPLWTITSGGTTYSFTLDTVNVEAQGSSFLTLKGTGVAHVTGYDDTSGVFDFSAQGFANGAFKFGFSADTVVPVPAALFFVAPALLGVFGVSRRKVSQAA